MHARVHCLRQYASAEMKSQVIDIVRLVEITICLINKSRLDEQNFMYRLLFKDMY